MVTLHPRLPVADLCEGERLSYRHISLLPVIVELTLLAHSRFAYDDQDACGPTTDP